MPPQSLLETPDINGLSDTDPFGSDSDQDENHGYEETIAYWLVGSCIINHKLTDGSFVPTPFLDLDVFRVFVGWYLVNQVSKTTVDNQDCLLDDLD